MTRAWYAPLLLGVMAVAAGLILWTLVADTGSDSTVREQSGALDGQSNDLSYDIVSLLPRDAIPAIDNPHFVSGSEADAIYHPDEIVLGVEIDGDARAYSVPFLSGHEIVNDEVGGLPIAVTW